MNYTKWKSLAADTTGHTSMKWGDSRYSTCYRLISSLCTTMYSMCLNDGMLYSAHHDTCTFLLVNVNLKLPRFFSYTWLICHKLVCNNYYLYTFSIAALVKAQFQNKWIDCNIWVTCWHENWNTAILIWLFMWIIFSRQCFL